MAEFLSSSGISINCYDKNEKHVEKLKNGENFLKFEKGIEAYRKNNNDLKYFLEIDEALINTNICFITVPTPSTKNGNFTNSYIIKTLENISEFLLKNNNKNPYVININSTVMPGSFQKELIAFHSKYGVDYKHY